MTCRRALVAVLCLLGASAAGAARAAVPLAVTSVAPSAPSGAVSQPIAWTASTTGGTAPLEFRFLLRNETTHTWTVLREYGPSSSVSWTPSTPGSYFAQVWARSAGSIAAWDAWNNSPLVTISAPLTVTSLTSAPAALAAAGTPVTWTALTSGGTAPLQFQFWLRNETTGAWTLLKPYSISNTASGTPTAGGSYSVQVWVRSSGSTAPWDTWANSATVRATSAASVISSLTVTPSTPSPVSLGIPLTWSAAASGGTAPLSYRFLLRNVSTGAWSVLQEYGAASTASWVPSVPGSYYVQVWARSAGSSAAADASANSAMVIVAPGPPAPAWTVAVSGATTQTITWPSEGTSSGYRVYRASTRAALAGRLPAGAYVQSPAPPLVVSADPNVPQYYRVFGVRGTLVGDGGPIAVSTAVTATDALFPPAGTGDAEVLTLVTPGLWDIDGDGCLDLVGARGACDGRFEPYPLDQAGLAGLFAPGRVNRDSRFADVTGDGKVDIFTNVYSAATNTVSQAILHVGNGQGGFTEDPGVAAMGIGGFGETVVAADFDNDGDVDLFLPHYSHRGDGGHNWLLVNDGAGHFTDVSATAGIASNLPYVPEGAQALDFNQDGRIDIAVSSHLYINNGNLTFTNRAAAVHVPARFDEGMKYVDVDQDGDFDLVHHDGHVTKLYRNVGGVLDGGADVDGSTDPNAFGYGLSVCDVNGDGFEDVLVAHNESGTGMPHLLLNVGGTLRRSYVPRGPGFYNDLLNCADLDRSGLPDAVVRFNTPVSSGFRTLLNRAASPDTLRIRVLGAHGERNQQGRVVRVRPAAASPRTLLRVVESGSGYMSQGDYDLLVAAPWPGAYEVAVLFAGGWYTTTARAGDSISIYADRRVQPTPPPPAKVVAVTPSAESGVVGTPVTLTALGRNGIAPLQYRFLLFDITRSAWTVLQEYGPASTASWTPAAAGTYLVQVWIRSSASTADWETWANSAAFSVAPP